MPEINLISRKKLISKLKALGFEGPFIAAKHQYMLKEMHKVVSHKRRKKNYRTRM